MRRLKASRYNIVLKEENDTIVFNAKNCALVKVNDIFLELLKNPNKRAGNDYVVLSKQMMDAGELPTHVYTKCGFNDYSSFYRAYVKYFGTAPTEKKDGA